MDANQIQIYSISMAVMWGLQLQAVSRYRPFNTQYIYRSECLSLAVRDKRENAMQSAPGV